MARGKTKFSLRAQPSRILFYSKTGKGEHKTAGKKRSFHSGHSRAASCFIQKQGKASAKRQGLLKVSETTKGYPAEGRAPSPGIVPQRRCRGNTKYFLKIKKRQACKPGSVPSGSPAGSHHLSGTTVARSLYLPTPRKTEHGQHSAPKGFSVYAAFHPVRFARLVVSPRRRWALTPPFHPYRPASGEAVVFCCTVCGAGDASHAPSR